jgi:hypothetical protein
MRKRIQDERDHHFAVFRMREPELQQDEEPQAAYGETADEKILRILPQAYGPQGKEIIV